MTGRPPNLSRAALFVVPFVLGEDYRCSTIPHSAFRIQHSEFSIPHSALKEEGSVAHAARGSDGRHEGRQGGYDDFYHDFDDVFLFVVHDVLI